MHQLANERHAVPILENIRQYDTFLESLRTICDMGCGSGADTTWWATLENYDDPPEPYNFRVFAVDRDPLKLDQVPDLTNITKINKDFTNPSILPTDIDFMWAHDCLQYSTNPLETLKYWNEQMTTNGMMILSVPQHSGVEYNRYTNRTYTGCYYHFTPTNLIYMLAVNGFDCRDAYLLKKFNDPWIQMAVYKSDVAPMDPKTTTWLDLANKNLLHPSIVNSIEKNGHLRQEEIVMPWLDKENYFIDWLPVATEIPVEAGEPIVQGIFNKTIESNVSTIQQGELRVKESTLLKPIGVLRPPKGRYVK